MMFEQTAVSGICQVWSGAAEGGTPEEVVAFLLTDALGCLLTFPQADPGAKRQPTGLWGATDRTSV